MRKSTSGTFVFMICFTAVSAMLAAAFYALHGVYGGGFFLSVCITFLTVSYHFGMRLAVGTAVASFLKEREFNSDSFFFRIRPFESKFYEKLCVKKWEKKVITAQPEMFDLRENTLEELLHNMEQAELVHRIIMLLSFVPLLFIIPFGEPGVFAATSVFACLADYKFVIIQRYNRPQVERLIKMKKERAERAERRNKSVVR